MPIYGFEACASVSSNNNSKKENKLPTITTTPVKLIKLRNTDEGRGAEPVSGEIEFMFVDAQKCH